MAGGQTFDCWQRGDPYEQYVGRWSRRVAPLFVSWLNIPAGQRWLDVGCGTGALTAAIYDHASPASVAGVEPSRGFLESARARVAAGVSLHRGSATAIPLDADSVDVTVSGLMLNFVPDVNAALLEMSRVTRTGGTIAAYVWDYAGKMEPIRYFWDTAVELDPQAANLDEGARFPLCNPEMLRERFEDFGLGGVALTSLDVNTSFESFNDYWDPFLGGQGPAPTYAMSLNDGARERLRNESWSASGEGKRPD